jgi:hypothetical protein
MSLLYEELSYQEIILNLITITWIEIDIFLKTVSEALIYFGPIKLLEYFKSI